MPSASRPVPPYPSCTETRADAEGNGHASSGLPRAVRGIRGPASQGGAVLRPPGNGKDVDGEGLVFSLVEVDRVVATVGGHVCFAPSHRRLAHFLSRHPGHFILR